jgi:hypothetical protein
MADANCTEPCTTYPKIQHTPIDETRFKITADVSDAVSEIERLNEAVKLLTASINELKKAAEDAPRLEDMK